MVGSRCPNEMTVNPQATIRVLSERQGEREA